MGVSPCFVQRYWLTYPDNWQSCLFITVAEKTPLTGLCWCFPLCCSQWVWGFPGGSGVENRPAGAGDMGLIPGLGGSSEGGNGSPHQYSCLENPVDRGAWQAGGFGWQCPWCSVLTQAGICLLSLCSPCVDVPACTHPTDLNLALRTEGHRMLSLQYHLRSVQGSFLLCSPLYLVCLLLVTVVPSLSHVWFFVTPWTAAGQASLSFTVSQSLLKFMSIESVMPSNHLILCRPLLLLPSSFPAVIPLAF